MKQIYLLLAFLCFGFINGQDSADIDPSFNQFYLPFNNYFVEKLVTLAKVLPDDKILLVENGNKLIRLNNNILDTSFNTGLGFNGHISDFVLQPDGKIIVVGKFTNYNDVSANKIVRLQSNGDIDTSFNSGTGFNNDGTLNNEAKKIIIQPDGKILVSVSFTTTTYNGISFNSVIRLNENGSIDNTFAADNAAQLNNKVNSIYLQNNGKILVVKYNNSTYNILRLNSNGTLDSTFNSIETNNLINDIVFQVDGKIIFAGAFTSVNSQNINFVTRINQNGTLDTSFQSPLFNGFTYSPYINKIIIQNDGNIILSGTMYTTSTYSPNKNLLKLNSDGSLNTNFNIDTTNPSKIYGISNFSDGQLLIYGDFNNYLNQDVFKIAKINTNGSIDSTFKNICKGFNNDIIHGVGFQPDGKIILSGPFQTYNGVSLNSKIVRLNADGSLDTSFYFDGFTGFYSSGSYTTISKIVIQPDGKILIGGYFNSYSNNILRLNADGSRDTSFNTNSSTSLGFDDYVYDIVVQPDGKILIAGGFTNYRGSSCNNIVRLNPNGSIDTTFSPYSDNVGLNSDNSSADNIYLLPNGKILVQGYFKVGSGFSFAYGIKRINANGSLDTSFSLDSSVIDPTSLFVQQSGKFVSFAKLVGSNFGTLKRFNADGDIDTSYNFDWNEFNTFGIPTGNLTFIVDYFTKQQDDKIYIGGYALSSSASDMYFFKRINVDGSVDTSFVTENNFRARIDEFPNGSLLMSNFGKSYFGVPNRNVIRLYGDALNTTNGMSKLDTDVNGCDANDIGFSNLKFQVSGSSTFDVFSNHNGEYSIQLKDGSFMMVPIFENPSYFNISPSSIAVNFPNDPSPYNQDFCITPNGNHPDLEVILIPLEVARPGFDSKYKLVFKNKGNQLQSGSVSLVFDDNVLDLVSSVPAQSSLSGNTLTWNYTNLFPMETREVSLTFNANTPTENPPLNGNDILSFTASILSPLTDEMPNDNTFTLNQTVVNSYDPNDKTCLQGEIVSEESIDNFVHYVIRFENSGTYAAQNITVTDYIDGNKFDISTLVPLKGSHLFTTKISDGNKVDFIFENINLPFDDANNDGYVAFKIKTKSSLVVGDTFSNSANIYFDYNSAITTNEFVTTIESTLSNPDYVFEEYFTVYPNPANDILNINKKDEVKLNSISIYNTLGQQVLVIPNAQNIKQIDITKLKTGAYFMLVNSDNGHSSVKFVKE